MSVDRQLPIVPTERIDPSTQVVRMPGTDAICLCGKGLPNHFALECLWPFCAASPTEEDE